LTDQTCSVCWSRCVPRLEPQARMLAQAQLKAPAGAQDALQQPSKP